MLSEADFNRFMIELRNAGKAVAAIERVRFGGFLFWKGNINSLRKEVAKRNLLIREGAERPRDKLALLHHEGLIDEANVLRSALQSALALLHKDADTRTKQYLQVAISWLKTFVENVNKHKILCQTNAPGTEEFEKIILFKYEQHKNRLLMAIDDVIRKEAQLSANTTPDVGRRRVLAYAAAGLVAAFTGTAYGQDSVAKTSFEPAKVAKEISEADIAKLMMYESVEDILNEKEFHQIKLDFVKYDARLGNTNYDTLVFQRDVKSELRKPVIAFFYRNKDPPGVVGEAVGVGQRSAILLKLLDAKFPEFKKVAYNTDADLTLSQNHFAGFKKYDLKNFPSFIIYGLSDVTKKEQPSGEVILVDIVRGGPKDVKFMFDIFKGISEYLIPTNIVAPNGKYVWRLNNSSPWKWEKVEY